MALLCKYPNQKKVALCVTEVLVFDKFAFCTVPCAQKNDIENYTNGRPLLIIFTWTWSVSSGPPTWNKEPISYTRIIKLGFVYPKQNLPSTLSCILVIFFTWYSKIKYQVLVAITFLSFLLSRQFFQHSVLCHTPVFQTVLIPFFPTRLWLYRLNTKSKLEKSSLLPTFPHYREA